MFAGYNKGGKSGTLTGNWVEEEALKQEKVTAESEGNSIGTYQRVIKHDASQKQGGSVVMKNNLPSEFGLRKEQKLKQMYEKAKEVAIRPTSPNQDSKRFESSTAAAFLPIDPKYIVEQSQTAPRGNDGRGIKIDSGTQLRTKGDIEHHDQAQLSSFKKGIYSKDEAVSIYSHSIKSGKGLNFTASCSSSANPFERSTAFTNDIRDCRKDHGEATLPGARKATKLGATMHQTSALESIKQQLSSHSPLKHAFFKSLETLILNRSYSFEDFKNMLKSSGFKLSSDESQQLYVFFDIYQDPEAGIREFRSVATEN